VFGGEPGPYYLADGHHRYQAAQEAGCTEAPCQLHPGDKRDALLYACGANHAHGLRRSAEDRKNAIITCYNLDRGMSGNRIAQLCRVSEERVRHYLGEYKKTLAANPSSRSTKTEGGESNFAVHEDEAPPPDIRVCADGRKRDVSRIGKSRAAAPACESAAAAPAPVTPPPWAGTVEQIDGIVRALRDVQARLNAIAGQPGAELLRANGLRYERHGGAPRHRSADVANAISELQHWKPHASCPSCREAVSPGCQLCKGLGWITESTAGRLPERLKAHPANGSAIS
jgi:hypothetical protein